MDVDEALMRVWELVLESWTDELQEEIERLLPALIEAGYVESDEHTWHFSKRAVRRIDELEREQ